MTNFLTNIIRSEGESWQARLQLMAPGNRPLDLNDAEIIEWAWSDTADSAAPLFVADFTTGGGLTIVEAVEGRIDASISPAAHAAVVPRAAPYFHQCRVVMLDGSTYIQFQGAWTVLQSPFVA